MIIKEFFDHDTATLTYVVHRQQADTALIIDPVLDFDPASGRIHEGSVNRVLAYLREHNLRPEVCLETHAHADHLSGSQILKRHYPQMQVAISARITEVQRIFAKAFRLDVPVDGSQFDLLLEDGQTISFAGIKIKVIPTPGHTPACTSFLMDDAVFTGDAIFMPDYGVGRCDFPGGSASLLYDSLINNLYSLPDQTRVFVGHDYQPGGRPLQWESTIGEQKKSNKQVRPDVSKAAFIALREARDKTLSAPRLLLPSIQVNILAGHLPEPEANGVRYLKIPLKLS